MFRILKMDYYSFERTGTNVMILYLELPCREFC
jgi:hypothetical protein